VSQKATVVAYAVHPRVPAREVVGLDLGEAKDERFCTEASSSLKAAVAADLRR
jgi:hypothetical protein